jgi:hypothetical protein
MGTPPRYTPEANFLIGQPSIAAMSTDLEMAWMEPHDATLGFARDEAPTMDLDGRGRRPSYRDDASGVLRRRCVTKFRRACHSCVD